MRLAVSCSLALLLALGAAQAQDRMRRGDDPVPVANPAAKPAAKQPIRAMRKPAAPPATAAMPAPAGTPKAANPRAAVAAEAAASRRDIAECAQEADAEKQIAGCTRLIDNAKLPERVRAVAYYNRGNALAAKGDQDAAIAEYDAAIKLTPKNSLAYNNRGTVFRDKGDGDRALADFAEAVKLNPRNSDAHYNLGNAYVAKGETQKAIASYGAAIMTNRRNANAYVARAIAQLYAGAAAKAQMDLWSAARIAPTNAYAALWLDIAQRRAKRPGTFAITGKRVDMNAWPAPVIKLWRGEIAPDALIAAADNPNAATKQAQVCEANFYGGELALLKGTKDEATKLLQAAAKDCPAPFLERMAANAELKALGIKVD
jgi:lipoprotein NlpI